MRAVLALAAIPALAAPPCRAVEPAMPQRRDSMFWIWMAP